MIKCIIKNDFFCPFFFFFLSWVCINWLLIEAKTWLDVPSSQLMGKCIITCANAEGNGQTAERQEVIPLIMKLTIYDSTLDSFWQSRKMNVWIKKVNSNVHRQLTITQKGIWSDVVNICQLLLNLSFNNAFV